MWPKKSGKKSGSTKKPAKSSPKSVLTARKGFAHNRSNSTTPKNKIGSSKVK